MEVIEQFKSRQSKMNKLLLLINEENNRSLHALQVVRGFTLLK